MRSTEFEARPRLSFPRVLGGASYTSPHLRLLCILHSSFCPPSRPPPVAVRSTLKHFFPICVTGRSIPQHCGKVKKFLNRRLTRCNPIVCGSGTVPVATVGVSPTASPSYPSTLSTLRRATEDGAFAPVDVCPQSATCNPPPAPSPGGDSGRALRRGEVGLSSPFRNPQSAFRIWTVLNRPQWPRAALPVGRAQHPRAARPSVKFLTVRNLITPTPRRSYDYVSVNSLQCRQVRHRPAAPSPLRIIVAVRRTR